MEHLFEYQINYYSDSKNNTILPYSLFGLTQQGQAHQSMSIGNQDAGSIYIGKKIIIGVVADGCTSGFNLNGKSSNQVGAQLGSYLTVRILRKLILKKHTPLSKELLLSFEQELLINYKKLLNTLNPWQNEKDFVVKNLFLTTLTFFIVTDKEYLIANCGDSDIIINGLYKNLTSDGGKYFASNLKYSQRLENGKLSLEPNLRFNQIDQGYTSDLNNIFISTDGFLDSDIISCSAFQDFFINDSINENTLGFIDRKTEFRREFLGQVQEMKDGRIWPYDDATFISLRRIFK